MRLRLALKARFNRPDGANHHVGELRFQRRALSRAPKPGALPQARDEQPRLWRAKYASSSWYFRHAGFSAARNLMLISDVSVR
jgi:hypothetical protein